MDLSNIKWLKPLKSDIGRNNETIETEFVTATFLNSTTIHLEELNLTAYLTYELMKGWLFTIKNKSKSVALKDSQYFIEKTKCIDEMLAITVSITCFASNLKIDFESRQFLKMLQSINRICYPHTPERFSYFNSHHESQDVPIRFNAFSTSIKSGVFPNIHTVKGEVDKLGDISYPNTEKSFSSDYKVIYGKIKCDSESNYRYSLFVSYSFDDHYRYAFRSTTSFSSRTECLDEIDKLASLVSYYYTVIDPEDIQSMRSEWESFICDITPGLTFGIERTINYYFWDCDNIEKYELH